MILPSKDAKIRNVIANHIDCLCIGMKSSGPIHYPAALPLLITLQCQQV